MNKFKLYAIKDKVSGLFARFEKLYGYLYLHDEDFITFKSKEVVDLALSRIKGGHAGYEIRIGNTDNLEVVTLVIDEEE